MDPITGGLIAQLGAGLLSSIFSPPAAAASGPTQAQIQAVLSQQAATRAAESTRTAWMIGLGVAAVGAVGAVFLLSRK
jgi:hypothetical protein